MLSKLTFLAWVSITFLSVSALSDNSPKRKPSMAPAKTRSTFVIKWNDSKFLSQSDSLGCPGEGNTVTIKVPGHMATNFDIENVDAADCFLKSVSFSGEYSTIVYEGTCQSDNDVNFIVKESTAPNRRAEITVDAGC